MAENSEKKPVSTGIEIEKLPLGYLLKHLSVGSWVWITGGLAAIFFAGYQAPLFFGKYEQTGNRQELTNKIRILEGDFKEEHTRAEKAEASLRDSAADLKKEKTENESLTAEFKKISASLGSVTTERDNLAIQFEEKNEQLAELDTARFVAETLASQTSKDLEVLQGEFDQCISDKTTAMSAVEGLQSDLAACTDAAKNASVDLWLVYQGQGSGFPEGNNGEIHNHDDRENWNSRRYKRETCTKLGGPRIDANYAKRLCGNDKKVVGPLGVFDIAGTTCGHGFYLVGCLK